MHPNTYLKTFWRSELRPQIFVAMSFDKRYDRRFANVISRAISTIQVNGVFLRPYRVDTSKSGDSILSDIMDGIAHSEMVLADVSTFGRDAVSGLPFRNANVLYEVGIALACRQPSEVLLIRDDEDRFLFDVSTIPHMKLDFSNEDVAAERLQAALLERLTERNLVNDARVRIAVESLSAEELQLLREYQRVGFDKSIGFKEDDTVNFLKMAAIPRLLDKGVLHVVGRFEEGHIAYRLTRLGSVVADAVFKVLPVLPTDQQPIASAAAKSE